MKITRTISLTALTLLLITPSTRTYGMTFYGRAEQLAWEEFSEGARILKEDGLRYGIGVNGIAEDFDIWQLGFRAEGTLGSVDYEGHTFGGEPKSSNTDYFGLRTEIYASFLARDGTGLNAHPILGIGGRYWIRRISKGSANNGGYDEGWLTIYGQLGVELEWIATGNLHLYARMLRRPAIYNNTQYSLELEDEKTFSLKPGRDTTWDLEVGIAYRDIQLSAFYETLSFKRSPSRIVPPIEAYQPESEGTLLGLQLGISW